MLVSVERRSTCIETTTRTRAGCSALLSERLQKNLELCADALHLPQIAASVTRPKYLRMLCPAARAVLTTAPVVAFWGPQGAFWGPQVVAFWGPHPAAQNKWLVAADERGHAHPDLRWEVAPRRLFNTAKAVPDSHEGVRPISIKREASHRCAIWSVSK